MGHGGMLATAVTLNQPGRYLHWSNFTVSVANLVPDRRHGGDLRRGPAAAVPPGAPCQRAAGGGGRDGGADRAAADAGEPPGTSGCGRPGSAAGRSGLLPRGSCCPTASPPTWRPGSTSSAWRTLAALGAGHRLGLRSALGGPDWWHYNPVGHFFNSLHLWSVELFMALLVIHLWGKFWMAAWRGRAGLTWITGVVAFVASVVECFTGYLSQQNFDSQWISTNGKDAFNAVGIGAFFNLMNFGQMLMWHIVLVPIVLVAHGRRARPAGPGPRRLASAARPPGPRPGGAPARPRRGRRGALARPDPPLRHPQGGHHRRRDRRCCWSSPWPAAVLARRAAGDRPELGQVAPADFLATAASELNGTSETATYGPPYNHAVGSTQSASLFAPANCAGVRQPIDAAQRLRPRPAGQGRRPATRRWRRRWPPTTPRRRPAAASGTPPTSRRWPRCRFVNGRAGGPGGRRRAGPGACSPPS